MLIMDTDHVSELARGTNNGRALEARLVATEAAVVTTIVTIEELLRGRLAQIARAKTEATQMSAYERLQSTLMVTRHLKVLPFDSTASSTFQELQQHRLGVGTMDLRIAAIAIASNATLLSRNLKDFSRVPDLKVEDWLS
jgi:tRNA(fMet)-specific endonuclease VapC